MKYQLNSNVRIVQFQDTFCFRKGIWDFNEAVLDVSQEPQAFKRSLSRRCDNLDYR